MQKQQWHKERNQVCAKKSVEPASNNILASNKVIHNHSDIYKTSSYYYRYLGATKFAHNSSLYQFYMPTRLPWQIHKQNSFSGHKQNYNLKSIHALVRNPHLFYGLLYFFMGYYIFLPDFPFPLSLSTSSIPMHVHCMSFSVFPCTLAISLQTVMFYY